LFSIKFLISSFHKIKPLLCLLFFFLPKALHAAYCSVFCKVCHSTSILRLRGECIRF
jgi:hypothetical protein